MFQKREARMAAQRLDIALRPRRKVVDAENRKAAIEQRSAQMRTDKSRAAGNECVQFSAPS